MHGVAEVADTEPIRFVNAAVKDMEQVEIVVMLAQREFV